MKTIILFITVLLFSLTTFSQNAVDWNSKPAIDNSTPSEPKIYPNPCKQQKVTVELNSAEITEIKLTNIAGKEVLLKKYDYPEHKIQLQLSEIPDGIYLIRIKTNGNNSIVKKLLVSKN